MKAVFEKARNALGYTRNNPRLDPEHELQGVVPQRVLVNQTVHSPSHGLLAADCDQITATGGDEVLFSKNNVLLKCQVQSLCLKKSELVGVNSEESELTSPVFPEDSSSRSKSLDSHDLIPGFLFVTTRGSNFGTTLILNWAPNSSMKVPIGSNERQNSSAAVASGYCASVSVDLCLMEMIRIFYRVDDNGFIMSGELIVKSKEEEFKVNFYVQ